MHINNINQSLEIKEKAADRATYHPLTWQFAIFNLGGSGKLQHTWKQHARNTHIGLHIHARTHARTCTRTAENVNSWRLGAFLCELCGIHAQKES